MIQEKIGVIGVGNMGAAILEGLLEKKLVAPGQIWIEDKIAEKKEEFCQKWPVHAASSNLELVKEAKIILLAVKPQDLQATAAEIKTALEAGRAGVISILAGIPVAKLKSFFGEKVSVVRAMPNLGAKVGESLTALTGDAPLLPAAEAIFSGCGKTIRLEEHFFDLVTALSGSGPAYFFYLMELMVQEGVQRGLSADDAKLLAIQTALGAAKLAAESQENPQELRKRVTSKGGTTEAALSILTAKWPEFFTSAIGAAEKRGQELSRS